MADRIDMATINPGRPNDIKLEFLSGLVYVMYAKAANVEVVERAIAEGWYYLPK